MALWMAPMPSTGLDINCCSLAGSCGTSSSINTTVSSSRKMEDMAFDS